MPAVHPPHPRALARALIAVAASAAIVMMGAAPARQPTAFRVCADPNNLPFSNRSGAGFENEIAQLIAHDLGLPVQYDWLAQSVGFARKTVNSGACDVIMGVPAHGYDPVLATKPYYRSTYVFLYRADRGWHISSMDDTLLTHLKIGVHLIGNDYENTPPVQALAARGIIDNVKGYKIIGDYSKPNPPSRLVDAVASGEVDVAIIWGPFAGYFAPRERVKLVYTPVTPSTDPSGQIFAFDIAMGVRHRDRGLAAKLDTLIDRERPAIHRILTRYGVPMVSGTDTAVSSQ